jgi:hypothetical protein
MKIFSLFQDRHDLPSNDGSICLSFNFSTLTVVKNDDNWNALLNEGGKLLVTGLTPALIEFLIVWKNKWYFHTADLYAEWQSDDCPRLILLHYNNVTKEYWEQKY